MFMKQLQWRVLIALVTGFCCLGRASAEGPAAGLREGNARVVFVGDSITGQSRNRAGGFANVMEAALRAVYPGCKPDLVALGGSGQPLDGWLNIEATTRTTERTLDVRGVEVKASLDQPADVLVVMLGMNDVLAPYLDGSEKALDRWIEHYGQLVEALRQRVHPKILALGGVTLCTEDLASPKNRLIDQMNERVRVLAQSLGACYLPTSETMKQVLKEGRMINPGFHLSYDFVHPNDAGHLATAIAMLRGLGEPQVAQWLLEQRLNPIMQKALDRKTAISWEIVSTVPEGDGKRFVFRIRYDWPEQDGDSIPQVKLTAGEGWSVTPKQLEGASGEFVLTGAPSRLRNEFVLEGRAGKDERRTTGVIAAPWLLTAKLIQPQWAGETFEAQKARTPIDDAIEKQIDFTTCSDADGSSNRVWQPCFPSGNYLGGEDPSNIDFSAITHAVNFEAGYGARWIHSDRERAVKVRIGSKMLAGAVYLTLWMNGEPCYQGLIMKEPGRTKTVDATLHKGWNTLAFKANHRTWLWQFSIDLVGSNEDSLSDLLYATKPGNVADKQEKP